MPFLLLLILHGALLSDPVSPSWIQALGYRPMEVSSIAIGRYGFPYVSVLINNQEVDLAVDTANMTGLFVASEVAQRLALPTVGEWTSVNTDGSTVGKYRVFQAAEVIAFGEVRKNENVHERPERDLDGAIGPRFLSGRRFTLDYQNRLMAVSQSPLPESAGEALPLIAAKGYEGMIVVRGTVGGREALIQVDTGKSRTCVDAQLVAALGLPKTENGYRVDEIRLGSFTFSVPSAKELSFRGISEGLPGPILLGIGSDVLSAIVLTVDYPGKRLLIGKAEGR